MRILGYMFALAILLAGTSVHAQKSAPAREYSYDICVQDNATGSYLAFNSRTGDFEFIRCSDQVKFQGVGFVKMDGCSVSFESVSSSYRVVASVNLCDQQGKAAVEVYQWLKGTPQVPPMNAYLTDSDLRNSARSCVVAPGGDTGNPPVPPTPEAQATEFVVQNDIDGSFLHLNTLTGEYKFIHCEDGAVITGIALVKTDGCALSFEDVRAEYRVLASINTCAREGKVAIEVFQPIKTASGEVKPMAEYISDNNLSDNLPQCGAKK